MCYHSSVAKTWHNACKGTASSSLSSSRRFSHRLLKGGSSELARLSLLRHSLARKSENRIHAPMCPISPCRMPFQVFALRFALATCVAGIDRKTNDAQIRTNFRNLNLSFRYIAWHLSIKALAPAAPPFYLICLMQGFPGTLSKIHGGCLGAVCMRIIVSIA